MLKILDLFFIRSRDCAFIYIYRLLQLIFNNVFLQLFVLCVDLYVRKYTLIRALSTVMTKVITLNTPVDNNLSVPIYADLYQIKRKIIQLCNQPGTELFY